ncbi:uncharacterized protein EV420DRAFT_227850 [Desarmillaria tabescens]|uniref:Uncharacterized protein n=1 Tax=Armillaria tabescens TaxID=1929756 RepID=A0AA39N803_ARMTA|nr:uncharacterized protein EV420DRAFT_227850 [Desarmillaria tabescens]KAK0460719.1 hypothetical protein EV420DRAFT_227850 [Desarmillaria tabescens]
MDPSYTQNTIVSYDAPVSDAQPVPFFNSLDPYAVYPPWYNAVPPPTYMPTSAYPNVAPSSLSLPQAPPGKQYYIPQFYYHSPMPRPSPTSFERNGTTYYIHNDHTTDGAFELNGTTFFPQSVRAMEEARTRACNTPAERRPFPGSRVINGTTYFPRVASDQILSPVSSSASSLPSSQTSTTNNSPATEATDSINQVDDLPPLVFLTLN